MFNIVGMSRYIFRFKIYYNTNVHVLLLLIFYIVCGCPHCSHQSPKAYKWNEWKEEEMIVSSVLNLEAILTVKLFQHNNIRTYWCCSRRREVSFALDEIIHCKNEVLNSQWKQFNLFVCLFVEARRFVHYVRCNHFICSIEFFFFFVLFSLLWFSGWESKLNTIPCWYDVFILMALLLLLFSSCISTLFAARENARAYLYCTTTTRQKASRCLFIMCAFLNVFDRIFHMVFFFIIQKIFIFLFNSIL